MEKKIDKYPDLIVAEKILEEVRHITGNAGDKFNIICKEYYQFVADYILIVKCICTHMMYHRKYFIKFLKKKVKQRASKQHGFKLQRDYVYETLLANDVIPSVAKDYADQEYELIVKTYEKSEKIKKREEKKEKSIEKENMLLLREELFNFSKNL